jgi:hypothetical protein
MPALATFWCHQTNASGKPTACRGWLSTHRDHAAVNLALIHGAIRPEDIPTEDESATYFESGTAACENGLRDIDDPSTAARVMATRLTEKGAGCWEDVDGEGAPPPRCYVCGQPATTRAWVKDRMTGQRKKVQHVCTSCASGDETTAALGQSEVTDE